MSKFAKIRRSNELPDYLAGINPEREKRLESRAQRQKEIRDGLKQGILTRAQFEEAVPHVEHKFGVLEQLDAPNVWEVRGDKIVRMDDEFVPAVLKAIRESPDLTDTEYEELISEFRSQYGE